MISSSQQRRLYVSLSLLGFCLAFLLLLPWKFTAVQASAGVSSNANLIVSSGVINLLEDVLKVGSDRKKTHKV